MQQFFDFFKGQFNSLNVVLLLLIAGIVLMWRGKRSSKTILISSLIFFILFSTDYLPQYLALQLESKYSSLNNCKSVLLNQEMPTVIHVLGGGYTADDRMTELAQLSAESTSRLVEGIRVLKCLDGARLICSGYQASGNKSLALVYKTAAVSLGVDSARISMLHEAGTTLEEAAELRKLYPKGCNLILVTSAIHMHRSMAIFTAAGFSPIAAPANFLIKDDKSMFHFGFLPSIENMRIMDACIREFLGSLKTRLQK